MANPKNDSPIEDKYIRIECATDIAAEIHHQVNCRRGVTISMCNDGVQVAGGNSDDLWDAANLFYSLYRSKSAGSDNVSMIFHVDTKEKPPVDTVPTAVHDHLSTRDADSLCVPAEERTYVERHNGAFIYSYFVLPADIKEKIIEELDRYQTAQTRPIFQDDSLTTSVTLELVTTSGANASIVERRIRDAIEKYLPEESKTPTIIYGTDSLMGSTMSPKSKCEFDALSKSLDNADIQSTVNFRPLEPLRTFQTPGESSADPHKEDESVSVHSDSSGRCSSGGEQRKRQKKKENGKGKKKKAPKPSPTKSVSPAPPRRHQNGPVVAVQRTIPQRLDHRHVSDVAPPQEVRETELFRSRDGTLHREGDLHHGHGIHVDFDFSDKVGDDLEPPQNVPMKSPGKPPSKAATARPSADAQSNAEAIGNRKRRDILAHPDKPKRRKVIAQIMESYKALKPKEHKKKSKDNVIDAHEDRTVATEPSVEANLPSQIGRTSTQTNIVQEPNVDVRAVTPSNEAQREVSDHSVVIHRQQSFRHPTVPSTIPTAPQSSHNITTSSTMQKKLGKNQMLRDAPTK